MKTDLLDDPVQLRPMARSDDDIALFVECFSRNGSAKRLDVVKWQYLDSPTGRLCVDLAVTKTDSPKIAAIYAVLPILMKLGSERGVLCVQSLDTLTDREFRGKGLFALLANQLYERIQQDGVQLVYGFPNKNSAHGFFSRLRWHRLDPFPFMIKPLRTGYFFRTLRKSRWLEWLPDVALTRARAPRLDPGQEIRMIGRLVDEHDDLWERFSESIVFAVERDSRYLNWRLSRPDQRYETIGLFEHGRIAGLAITGVQFRDGNATGKLMELIYAPGRDDIGKKLLQHAVRSLYTRNVQAIWVWNFDHSPNHPLLRRHGFVSLPQRLHPFELHVGARELATRLAAIGVRKNWYVSLLDSDTD